MTDSGSVPLNGIEMYYERRGEGEPLLLLHGGGGIGANWSAVFDFETPPPGYQLIVPDLRGHGRSTNPSRVVTFRQLALDVSALLDHLRIDRVKAIGMSMGAKTLLHLATQQPDRVDAMILVSGAPYFPEQARAIMRTIASSPHSDADWERFRRWHVYGDDQINALWSMAAQFAEDRTDLNFTAERLADIRARTLIVHGDRDRLYPVSSAMALHEGIRGSHLWVIPNGSHNAVFRGAAPDFVRIALEFLNDDWRNASRPAPASLEL